MAKKKRQKSAPDKTPETVQEQPADTKEPEKEPLQDEIFGPDEQYYEYSVETDEPGQMELPTVQEEQEQSLPISALNRRFSILQKVLVVNIILIAVVLVYSLAVSPSRRDAGISPRDSYTRSPRSGLPGEATIDETAQQSLNQGMSPAATRLASLKIAESLFAQKDYLKAYATYSRLRRLPASGSTGPDAELLRDFVRLRMACCAEKAGDTEQASRLFRTILDSRSPAVRIMGNYRYSLLSMRDRQYIAARTSAYQVIALVETIDHNRDWALSLERDCHFIAAETVTRKMLSLCDADKELPQEWPGNESDADPFANSDERQLPALLNIGCVQLSRGLLGPQIQKLGPQDGEARWSVVCHRTALDELLARFASHAGLDINWSPGAEPGPGTTVDAVRRRAVSLYLTKATTHEVLMVAAGCAGLLAQPQGDEKTVTILNPSSYASLSEHIGLLSEEATSLWRQFILTVQGNDRAANAHFALGLLQAQKGEITDAVAEYKLVANRFSQTPPAPYALLHSSKLKAGLRDYLGARSDLKQLVEQYPDAEFSDQACLYLAEATMKAQLYDEAARLYRKVYSISSTLESQAAAALGAGKCFYETDNHQAAAEWLAKYIGLAGDNKNRELYSACLLLGKINLALGRHEQACDAFNYALAGWLPKEQYLQATSALVQTHMRQDRFVEALRILENTPPWQFSQEESIEILLLKTSILRSMGLVDRAIATLGDIVEYLPDVQLKAKVTFELAKCFAADGEPELARRNLADILAVVEPGPLAQEIECELADVCLKLGRNSQTTTICLRLLDCTPPPPIKQKALTLLAQAYGQQMDYDKAVLALLGKWKQDNDAEMKPPAAGPTASNQTLLDGIR